MIRQLFLILTFLFNSFGTNDREGGRERDAETQKMKVGRVKRKDRKEYT